MKPLAIDLFAGLGGWTDGLLAEGWDVVGFDIEQHAYGDQRYPAQLVLQDVTTIVGRQFRHADLIVASPPCQDFSYMAMPWTKAKDKQARLADDPAARAKLTALFDACFRIQREACEASGRNIPLIVENVRGAQKWVGRSRWNYGSFHLWGDVPALMPMTLRGGKNSGGSWFNIGSPGQTEVNRNPVHALTQSQSVEQTGIKLKDQDGYERDHPEAFGWKKPRTSSGSNARKAASALIAKIPLPLARYIGRVFKPIAVAA